MIIKKKYYLFISLLLLANLFKKSIAQSDVAGVGGHVRQNGFYVGWNGTGSAPGSLDVRNNFNEPINFFTNTFQRMQIAAGGNVGIGTPNPAFLLDVLQDINAGGTTPTTTSAYHLGTNKFMWHNGNVTRVYVGVGAGNAASSASNNTFIGNNSGSSIVGGANNTFVGSFSGSINTSGFENSCFGALAGSAITTGAHQTMLGSSANPSVSNLSYATAVGAFSTVSQSNSLVLGAIEGLNAAPSSTSVGIGTPAPNSVLHLNRNTNTAVYTRYTNPFAPATLIGGGLEVGINENGIGIIRHLDDFPIEIWTSSGSPPTIPRINSTFTSNFTFGAFTTLGDGLRIHDPNNLGGNLDLWTSGSNQSHIVWGPNGRIQGINNRFEIQADFTNGLWFNVTNLNTGTFFNALGAERGRIGSNAFWRMGANAGNLNANRRLEVVDADNPQLRLTQATTSDSDINQGTRTDFQTTNTGNLFINPRNEATGANVGINVSAPTSRLHINSDDNLASALQITNTSGTEQAVGDGLRMGYAATTATNREAFINQQENDRLSLYTNNGERIRITQIGALNNGVTFPTGLANNVTRIGISHNPAFPVTRPLSLLHLGYNVDNPSSNDGWRSWMDVGMFTSRATDHLYIGMKDEPNGSDAVICWGDNNLADGAGPDNFRVIFTTPLGVGLGPGNTANGLEGMRMTPFFEFNAPDVEIGIRTGIGGDPIANPYFGTSANPTSTLEVNAWGSSPTTDNDAPADPIIGGTPTGLSGLRFTDLSSVSVPQLNPGTGVLAVDADGDVIYVPSNTAPNIGNYCPHAPNPITANFEVPLDNHNYYFSGQSTNTDVDNIGSSVGIGLDCGDPIPLAKFHVLQSITNPDYVDDNVNVNASLAGYFENDAVGEVTGGIKAYTHGESDQLIGGFFEAEAAGNDPSQTAFGVWGEAVNALAINAGVVGSAEIGDYNYGVYGRAYIGSNNYAIYGEVDSNTNSWAGFFDGDVYTSTSYSSSDVKLKDKINDFNSKDALNLIQMMKPKTYEYKQSSYPSLHLPHGPQIGLLAQEVEKAIPQLVKEVVRPPKFDNKGKITHPEVSFKGVNYIGLIPVLLGAVQEQQQQLAQKDTAIAIMHGQLDRMQQALDNLTALVSTCCAAAPQHMNKQGTEEGAVHTNDITLANLDAVILNQNVPNPFSEQTFIAYYIPKDVVTATMVFYNLDGKQINTKDIVQRGKGQLTVFADDLISGIYSYSIVIDGKVVETKRMTKTK